MLSKTKKIKKMQPQATVSHILSFFKVSVRFHLAKMKKLANWPFIVAEETPCTNWDDNFTGLREQLPFTLCMYPQLITTISGLAQLPTYLYADIASPLLQRVIGCKRSHKIPDWKSVYTWVGELDRCGKILLSALKLNLASSEGLVLHGNCAVRS